MASTSVPKAERKRRAQARAYEEALQRYSNELLPDEERMIIPDRLGRLQRALAK